MANYSLEEKQLLLHLVRKYKHIVENKKTDAYTNTDKENTWKKIEFEFNAVAPNNTHRNALSLKKAYINQKKSVRKEVAEEKTYIIKTGGGRAMKNNNPLREITLETMNEKTVFGFENHFDSDSVVPAQINIDDMDEDDASKEPGIEGEENEGIEVFYIETEKEDTPLENTSSDWAKWVAPNLRTPLSSGLQEKIKNVPSSTSTSEGTNNEDTVPVTQNSLIETAKGRRRPGITALHSSEISKIYTQLCQQKLANAQLENTVLQN